MIPPVARLMIVVLDEAGRFTTCRQCLPITVPRCDIEDPVEILVGWLQ